MFDAAWIDADLRERAAHRLHERRSAGQKKQWVIELGHVLLDECSVYSTSRSLPVVWWLRDGVYHAELGPVRHQGVEECPEWNVRGAVRVEQRDRRVHSSRGEVADDRAERSDADPAGDEHSGSVDLAVHKTSEGTVRLKDCARLHMRKRLFESAGGYAQARGHSDVRFGGKRGNREGARHAAVIRIGVGERVAKVLPRLVADRRLRLEQEG